MSGLPKAVKSWIPHSITTPIIMGVHCFPGLLLPVAVSFVYKFTVDELSVYGYPFLTLYLNSKTQLFY
jgi:hypothetical protein